MRRRIYVDGKPAWSENEPHGAPKRAGWGGAALGQAHTTFVVHQRPVPAPLRGEALLKKPRQRTYRARP